MSIELGVSDILKITGGNLIQGNDFGLVKGISIDSRSVAEGNCFIAIKGAHFDGHDFVADAVKKGARAVIVSRGVDIGGDVPVINVDDTVKALGKLAAFHRRKFNVPVVAITGSNGKSTTKQMTAAALRSLGKVLKTEGNFNNLIGLPLTVLRWEEDDKAAVLEMGMSAPGEIGWLTEVSDPDVGVITNISAAHIEFLHSIENVAEAKGELFKHMKSDGVAVVNLEDPRVVELARRYKRRTYTFGMQNNADVRFGRMESRALESVDMTLYVEGREYKMHLKVPGTHNVMNAMAALAVAKVIGINTEEAIAGIESFEPMSMRMERIQLRNGIQLVNDSYNANPSSMKEALRTVSGAKRSGRFVAVLGDMLELGTDSDRCHEEVGKFAASYHVDRLFVFGNFATHISAGAQMGGMKKDNISVYSDINKLNEDLLHFLKTGDVVLVKGSRGMKMERVSDFLKDEIGVE